MRDSTGRVLAVVRSRLSLDAIWSIVEGDQGSVGTGAAGLLVDDYGIRLAVSATKGDRARALDKIYTAIAPIAKEQADKLLADRRFGLRKEVEVAPLPELVAAIGRKSQSEALHMAAVLRIWSASLR